MTSRLDGLKKLQIALAGIAVTVLLIGFGATTSDIIPDHALIVVFPGRGEWVPMHEDALVAYKNIIGQEDFESELKIESSWRAVVQHTFGEIRLHKKIRNMNSWTTTANRPLILGLIFGEKKRWREDGTWIY